MSTVTQKILFVDDDNAARSLIKTVLTAKGFDVTVAASADEALRILKAHHEEFIFILSDMKMPGMDGLEFRRALLAENGMNEIPFAIMSGHVSREAALQAIDLKICKFLDKTTDHDAIARIIKQESRSRASALEEKQILKASFVEEASGILDDLEPLLLHLESNPGDIDTVNTIFRLVHTVKGASGVLGQPDITKFLHHYEDLLSKVKNAQIKATPGIVTVLLQAYDGMVKVINSVKAASSEPVDFDQLLQLFDMNLSATQDAPVQEQGDSSSGMQTAKVGEKKESVNVPTGMLDEFMALSGEITVIRNMVNKLVRSIERKIPSDKDVELLSDLLDEMHKINASMQTRITDLRKTPIASVVRKLPRTVRDLAHQLHKEVNIEIRGEDLRVDAAIGNVLSNSLIHMVRNCTDHGIEMPDARIAAGKPGVGHITLSCREANDTVIVKIEDDGKGIDSDRIRKKLVDSGRMSSGEVERLTKRQLFQTIFESGFSTAEKITDVSGRGVGMDMVRASVEGLRGRIDIDSEPGRGTAFTISLPTPKSVVIISSLIVCADDREFAIPQESIVRLMKLDDDRRRRDLTTLEGGPVLRFEGKLLPLISLSDAFQLGSGKAKPFEESLDDMNVVIVSAEELTYGIVVDRILDAEDIVVKTLHRCIERLQAFLGATFMGDGSIGLIVDVAGLAKISGFTFGPQDAPQQGEMVEANSQRRELLIFGLDNPGLFGFPLERVHRFEEFSKKDIKLMGTQEAIIYRDRLMPLHKLQTLLTLPALGQDDASEKIRVIVVAIGDRHVGLQVRSIQDVVTLSQVVDVTLKDRPGLAGSAYIGEKAVAVVDIDQILKGLGFADVAKPEAEVIELRRDPAAEILVQAEAPKPAAVGGEGWGLF